MAEDDPRNRLLNAAGPIFAEKGYQAATVREICREADANIAAVNYHFGDKARLYAETLKHAHRSRVAQVPLPEWSPETPPERRLRDFVHTMARRMLDVEGVPWQVQLIMREVLQPTGAARELVEEAFRPHFELLVGILGELLPAGTPLHRRHQLAFSVIGQCLFYRFHGGGIRMLIPEEELEKHFQTEQIAEHVSEVIVAALKPHAVFEGRPDRPGSLSSERRGFG